MADISMPATPAAKVAAAAGRVSNAVDSIVHGGLAAAASVAAIGVALAVLHVELQYVVAAFVIVFARRLASKRFVADVRRELEPTPKDAEDGATAVGNVIGL